MRVFWLIVFWCEVLKMCSSGSSWLTWLQVLCAVELPCAVVVPLLPSITHHLVLAGLLLAYWSVVLDLDAVCSEIHMSILDDSYNAVIHTNLFCEVPSHCTSLEY